MFAAVITTVVGSSSFSIIASTSAVSYRESYFAFASLSFLMYSSPSFALFSSDSESNFSSASAIAFPSSGFFISSTAGIASIAAFVSSIAAVTF